jgi:hypothetical protein
MRDELLVDASSHGRLRPIVFHDELEPASEETPLLVRVLDAELVATQLAPVWGSDAPMRIGGCARTSEAGPKTSARMTEARQAAWTRFTAADSTAVSGSAA